MANMGNLVNIIWSVVFIGLLVAFSLVFLAQTQTQVQTISGTGSAADNATGAVITAVSTVPNWLTLIILAGVFVVVIGLFMFMRGRNA